MHKWAKEILECVKEKAKAIGIDNFEGQNLDDLKDWTEIVKNIACFDKDYRIVEAMDRLENDDEIMEMVEQYGDYPSLRCNCGSPGLTKQTCQVLLFTVKNI